MPIATTFPGVYIQEIPSGVRTITGVATSITAFVGRAAAGPVNDPIVVSSFADYQRVFGGLSLTSTMSFAVRDFFLNGGSRAVVVRLFRGGAQAANEVALAGVGKATAGDVMAAINTKADTFAGKPGEAAANKVRDAAKAAAAVPGAKPETVVKAAADAAAATANATAVVSRDPSDPNAFKLEAVSPGAWANGFQMRVEAEPGKPNLFRLLVRDSTTGGAEVFTGLSVDPNEERFVKTVLERESQLVRVSGDVPTQPPPAHANATPPKGVFEDDDDNPATEPKTYSRVADAHAATDGSFLVASDFTAAENFGAKTGLYALRKTDLFNLLCIPPYRPDGSIEEEIIDTVTAFCESERALFIIDPPPRWTAIKDAGNGQIGGIGSPSSYAAVFFPRLLQPNPLRDNQFEEFVPCGAVAGVMARTDSERGVWKAPAGIEATLKGVPQLAVPLSDAENGLLNPLGVNCLRSFPGIGRVVWGARTREGDDRLASEWKYIPVRRTALFIEESLFRGTQWVVFEPNDEPLWAQIRLNIGAFMQGLFRQGAFQGKTPREAYFVKCDKETTTQNDIDRGVVNIIVGFAPLKPAEFVVIKLQQMAGQLEV